MSNKWKIVLIIIIAILIDIPLSILISMNFENGVSFAFNGLLGIVIGNIGGRICVSFMESEENE